MLAALRGLLVGRPAAAVFKALPVAVLDRWQSHSFASSSSTSNELGSNSSSTTTSGTDHASWQADPYPEMPVQQTLVEKVSDMVGVHQGCSSCLKWFMALSLHLPGAYRTVCRHPGALRALHMSGFSLALLAQHSVYMFLLFI